MTLKTVTTDALQETLQVGTDDVVLDVREKDEYAAGHIKEAFNYPLSELEELTGNLKKDSSYYIICQAGRRSEKAANYLHDLGYDVTNVEGGMNNWHGEVED
ncbi:rhodanese-like domain-containing protein [Macrococcus carouselicus]|uniref:Rhodanese-like domain-containing protein n=1 Tax=Macrococcus carouselicus TaxID=69969 RepID=A0A9Q8FQL3_9STAP|nr:rhodanese-like domain-containing protein [Macrococcus carouselicus]TDM03982.1 rhodanese-like domain-containing protein [Macrococcus carouselicus]